MSSDLLTGKSVVVTRASHQSGDLIAALQEKGAEVVPAPAIAVVPPLDGGQPLDDALLRLERFSWIAFTSSNAVSALMARAARRGVLKKFSGLRVAAIGPSTASKVIAELKREPDLVPSKNDGLSLAEAFPVPACDDHVLIPMASDGRPELGDILESKGWKVDRVAAYRTVCPSIEDELVARAIEADAVTFASPSAVKGHMEQTGGRAAPKVVAIGQTTAEECRVQGLEVADVAESQTTEGLVQAVIGVLG
ncbi:MAG TPA: uroporphyrinogen III synthase [Acidimicrobiaceae bacterium]|nr:uroporphyrinogen III synthase [Acidimicrobiaceae bacterium]